MNLRALLTLSLALPALAASGTGDDDPLLSALDAEMTRQVASWQGQEDAPYYLGYRVTDTHDLELGARYGQLVPDSDDRTRLLDVSVRVGTRELDSTHTLRDEARLDDPWSSPTMLPVDGSVAALRSGIWRASSDRVRQARQAIFRVRANRQVKVAETDPSPDFSVEQAQTSIDSYIDVSLDGAIWKPLLVDLSRRLDGDPRVERSAATLTARATNETILTSEGTRIRQGKTWYRIALEAQTTAIDGMDVHLYRWKDVADPARLPSASDLDTLADGLVSQVLALRDAPAGDPYTGPVLLRGAAAGVFVHEVLGHRVEGHRQKNENEGQTFRDKIGQAILPDFIDVVDDPTLATWAGYDLNGHYAFDEEGEPAARAVLVDHGVFRGFLMGRSPISGFEHSNGHGRAQPGRAPVSRMANTILMTRKATPYADLRKQLIDEVRKQGRPYGLIVDELEGGFTLTGRYEPNSFDVLAQTVWRVYPDGRPDELLRGVELIGTPLVALSHVVATGDDPAVFDGFCGAESGFVPNAAVSPSLLISQLELQKKDKSQDRPPLLPKPAESETAEVRP